MASAFSKPVELDASPSRANPTAEILSSWKEIARYLERGVRTVQRWESTLGLPVRRPHGRSRSAVFAVRSELDAWLQSCPQEERQEQISPMMPGSTQLLLEAQRLRSRVHDSRLQLGDTIARLVETLSGMLVPSAQD